MLVDSLEFRHLNSPEKIDYEIKTTVALPFPRRLLVLLAAIFLITLLIFVCPGAAYVALMADCGIEESIPPANRTDMISVFHGSILFIVFGSR